MAVKPIIKGFEYFLERLLKGFRSVEKREPNNLEMILIKQEAGQKARDANKVIKVDFGEPFGEQIKKGMFDDIFNKMYTDYKGGPKGVMKLVESGDVKLGKADKTPPYEKSMADIEQEIYEKLKADNEKAVKAFESRNTKKLDEFNLSEDDPVGDLEKIIKGEGETGLPKKPKKPRDEKYTGGLVDVEPSLSDIGHGSDALMARTRLMSPGSQATTSTGLNYLLAEDNDNIRVPFSKGKGVDFLRRGFLKTMGAAGAGIAALKTGLLGLGGKQATKEVAKEIITTPAAAGKPPWFDALVTRVIREGDDVTKTMATKDRQNVYRTKIDDETEIMVTQDLDEGVTRIDIDDSTRNVMGYDDPPTVSLQVTDEIVEEGGARIKPEFKATENDYRNYATDPDGGYETEFVENTVENTKDLTSDLTKIKSFATNKKETMKEFVESKKRKDNVKYANEKTSSYAADRGPDYDPSDYIDDMADDMASGGLAKMLGE